MRVAVVGNGIMGSWLTFDLLQKGHQVSQYFVANPLLRASEAATGVQVLKGLLLAKDPIFHQKQRGHNRLYNLLSNHRGFQGVPCIRGVLEPCFDSLEFTRRKKRICRRQPTACFDQEIFFNEPGNRYPLPEKSVAAFRYPSDYWFHPKKLLAAFQEHHNQNPSYQALEQEVDRVSLGGSLDSLGEKKHFDHIFVAAGSDFFKIFEGGLVDELKQKSNFMPGWSLEISPVDKLLINKLPAAYKYDTKSIVWDGENYFEGGFAIDSSKRISCLKSIEVEKLYYDACNFSETLLASRFGFGLPFNKKISKRLGVRIQCPRNRPVILRFPGVTGITGLHKSGFSLAPVLSLQETEKLG